MDEQPKVEQPMSSPLAGGDDVEKGKGMAWLSYLGILFLVPLLAMKENAFCKFHVKQGIMLCIYGVAVGIVGGAIPFLGWFIIAPVGSIIVLVLCIMGIINSLGGKYWVCPMGVGALAEKWFKF